MRTREGRRGLLFICILAAALLALFLLSFWLGSYDVPPSDVSPWTQAGRSRWRRLC